MAVCKSRLTDRFSERREIEYQLGYKVGGMNVHYITTETPYTRREGRNKAKSVD